MTLWTNARVAAGRGAEEGRGGRTRGLRPHGARQRATRWKDARVTADQDAQSVVVAERDERGREGRVSETSWRDAWVAAARGAEERRRGGTRRQRPHGARESDDVAEREGSGRGERVERAREKNERRGLEDSPIAQTGAVQRWRRVRRAAPPAPRG
jgi:hypothetical protein